jgi:hypothetical protein
MHLDKMVAVKSPDHSAPAPESFTTSAHFLNQP